VVDAERVTWVVTRITILRVERDTLGRGGATRWSMTGSTMTC